MKLETEVDHRIAAEGHTLPRTDLSAVYALMKAAHENSIAKGWWKDGNNLAAWRHKCVMIVTELGEAIQRWRDPEWKTHRTELRESDGKPEGFIYELADVLLRAFDLASAMNATTKAVNADTERLIKQSTKICAQDPFRYFLDLYTYAVWGTIPVDLWRLIAGVFAMGDFYGLDVWSAVQKKHAFNLGRPHRHGGKLS